MEITNSMPDRRTMKAGECQRLRDECEKRLTELSSDVKLVKIALVGPDMRGGLVNQVNSLGERLAGIVLTQKFTDDARDEEHARAEQKDNSRRARFIEKKDKRDEALAKYKVALIGVAGTLLGIILNKFLGF